MKNRLQAIDILHECISSVLESMNCTTPEKEIVQLKYAVDSASRGLELLKQSLAEREKSALLRWKAGR